MDASSLPSWSDARFQIAPDRDLLARLTQDMHAHAVEHRPAHWWMLPEEYSRGTMETMLDPWCGNIGQLPLSDPEAIERVSGDPALLGNWMDFAQRIVDPALSPLVDAAQLGRRGWRVLDLCSLIDCTLLRDLCDGHQGPLRILEVGGGFGRIAEFLALSGTNDLRYINIDAVPLSLMYSYLYLKERCPERSVELYFPGEDRRDVDFLIVPAWHSQRAASEKFDVCLNIESFQEMSQTLVDAYIKLFDDVTDPGKFIFLTNSRDYKFQGLWTFPRQWECVFRHRTVRAWTRDHPTEIFRKSARAANNRVRQYFYEQELSRQV